MLEKEAFSTVQAVDGALKENQPIVIDQFVQDFLKIWRFIHEKAPSLSLNEIKEFTVSLLQNHTLPFFKKYSTRTLVEKYNVYLKTFSSIVINWDGRGRILFPIRLVTYEIIYHKDGLFSLFIERIMTGALKGTVEDLFVFLFPRLINVTIPLSDIDLRILKTVQRLDQLSGDLFKGSSINTYSTEVGVSDRTILRRLNHLNYLQIVIPVHFLDLGLLGYETYLLSHFKPIPEELTQFVFHSVNMVICILTIIQVPISKPKILKKFQEQLDPIIFQKLDERVQSWNLSALSSGNAGWHDPPSFIFCDPITKLTSVAPQLKFDLNPKFDTFRELTRADLKILEFITNTGSIGSRRDLSKAVGLSPLEVGRRLAEYLEHRLISKVHQFFNIGLDYSIAFFLTYPTRHNIPWIDHFLSFPKMDVFSASYDGTTFMFGHLRLASRWYKDFVRQVTKFKREIEGLKFYQTIEQPYIARWNISLKDTYR